MNNYSWTKAIVFGIGIWLSLFIVATILVGGIGLVMSQTMWYSLAILAGIVSYIFAFGTESATDGQALAYGAVWVAIGIILDAIITVRFQAEIFGVWQYYAGYALVLLAPWFEYEFQGSGAHPKAV